METEMKDLVQDIVENFKIDLIVWKHEKYCLLNGFNPSFKIDLIVWKHNAHITIC